VPQRHSKTFASDRDATAYVEAQIAAQRAKGYVELELASPAEAGPVNRTVRVEYVDEHTRARHFHELAQVDRSVSEHGGTRVRGVDAVDHPRDPPQVFETIADASAYVERRVEYFQYDYGADVVHRDAAMASYRPSAHATLEAQCRAAPDGPAPWAVYADWLISQGDIVGEIAARHAAGGIDDALQLIRDNLADLGLEDADGLPELTFRHGFIVGATFPRAYEAARELADVTRDFLSGPLARLVVALRFGLAGFESNNDWAPTLRAVCESPCAPYVRELRFDHYTYEDQEISWTAFGDFSFAWPLLPALEVLHIRAGAGGTLGDLHLPSLKTFVRESGGLAADELATIASAQWPKLEHLEVWFGSRDYGAAGSLASLEQILANDLQNLRHLGIVNCEFIDDVIPALASWPGLPWLHSLDLSKSVMHACAAASLVEHAKRFRHLASIDLSANLLEASHARAICGALDNVIIGEQRTYDRDDDEDDDDDEDASRRYVAVGE